MKAPLSDYLVLCVELDLSSEDYRPAPQLALPPTRLTLVNWQGSKETKILSLSATSIDLLTMRYVKYHHGVYAWSKIQQKNQIACYITHTTPETHQIIRDNLHSSIHIQETKKGIYAFRWRIYCPLSSVRSSLLSFARSKSSAISFKTSA